MTTTVSRVRIRTDAQAAQEACHMNLYWTFETHDKREITANFHDVHVLSDGTPLLVGQCVDEYGWWHTPCTVDITNVRAMRRAGGYKDPEDAPFEVSMRFEWRRTVVRLIIPDDVALRLNRWKHDNWTEIVGYGDGYTNTPRRGTWEHRALAYLHSVQSHLTDSMPFIEGVSFAAGKDEHGNGGNYDVFVSTCGIAANTPGNAGYHLRG